MICYQKKKHHLQVADSVGNVRRDDNIGESLDSRVLDGLLDAHLGSLGLAVHLGVGALENGDADAQT